GDPDRLGPAAASTPAADRTGPARPGPASPQGPRQALKALTTDKRRLSEVRNEGSAHGRGRTPGIGYPVLAVVRRRLYQVVLQAWPGTPEGGLKCKVACDSWGRRCERRCGRRTCSRRPRRSWPGRGRFRGPLLSPGPARVTGAGAGRAPGAGGR